MATNPFFSDLYTAETQDQALYDDLIEESIQIHGRDFIYLPREMENFDRFFGESATSTFRDAYTVEFYLENTESWSDEGSFLSKFGLEVRDSASLNVSKRRFKQEITDKDPEITRPREGDILIFPRPLDNRVRYFEITYVTGEEVFYQLGKLYVWKVTVKNFEYAQERFSTGDITIDDYQSNNAQHMEILLDDTNMVIPEFFSGERLTQTTGFSADLVLQVDNKLVLTNVSGEYNEAIPLVGDMTGLVAEPKEVITEVGNIHNITDNDQIRKESVKDGVIRFSETNPFSE